MITGLFALVAAAFFTGAAAYITLVEQPARLGLDDRAMLAQWKPAYKRGFALQAPLAFFGGVCGIVAYGAMADVKFLIGAIAMLANWPYTMLVILPTNKQLLAIGDTAANEQTRNLMLKWGQLHSVRTVLGAIATVCYAWGMTFLFFL